MSSFVSLVEAISDAAVTSVCCTAISCLSFAHREPVNAELQMCHLLYAKHAKRACRAVLMSWVWESVAMLHLLLPHQQYTQSLVCVTKLDVTHTHQNPCSARVLNLLQHCNFCAPHAHTDPVNIHSAIHMSQLECNLRTTKRVCSTYAIRICFTTSDPPVPLSQNILTGLTAKGSTLSYHKLLLLTSAPWHDKDKPAVCVAFWRRRLVVKYK